MICSVHTLGISGIQGSPVVAECYVSNGLPVLIPDLDGSDEEMRKLLFAEADNLEDVIQLL